MPIPKTKNVGKTIKFLKKEKPGMPQKQKVAIALNVAREVGVDIPMKKAHKSAMKRVKYMMK